MLETETKANELSCLKSSQICFVSVVNNFEIFNKSIKNNTAMSPYEQIVFDNTCDNISITKRYNSFIENIITTESDFWVVFCHQDFGFLEDPLLKLSKLDKNFMYGAIGTKVKRGLYMRNSRIHIHKRFFIGEIKQGVNEQKFVKLGKRINKPEVVDTLDCCCVIAHSSLIKKLDLRFDENLDFHMYAEDFCMNVKKKGIFTKVIQFDCFHIGGGTLTDEYYKCLKYMKIKYGINNIISTATDL